MAACVCDSALSGEVRFSAKGWRVQRRAGAPDVGRRGAVGSVQGSRGSSSVQGRVWRVFGRGACLTRAVRRSRSGLGTTLWLCSCKRKARQGKAQAGGEGEAGSGSDLWVPAPWSGLPEGEVQTGRWAVVVVVAACVFVLEQWPVYVQRRYHCRRRCCLVLVAGAGRGSFTEGGELGGDLPVPRLSIELPIECTSPSPDLPFTELSAFNCQEYIHPSSCSPHTNHQTHTWKGHMYHTQ
jgi:hypothetical protein